MAKIVYEIYLDVIIWSLATIYIVDMSFTGDLFDICRKMLERDKIEKYNIRWEAISGMKQCYENSEKCNSTYEW